MMELRLKSLERTKAYREAVSGLKDNEIRPRKRVIIAPSMKNSRERGGNVTCLPTVATQRAVAGKKQILDSSSLNENEKISREFTSYKAWVKERKQLRKNLNQCGMISDWLRSKPSLTEIERRVQDLQTTASNELSASRMRKENLPSRDGQVAFDSQDHKHVPVINQPLPVALEIINEYLAKKRLRFYDLFVQADRDKDWKVSRDEFKDVMKRTGIPLKDSEIDQFIHALDKNHNDELEYKELAHGRNLFILSARAKKQLEEEGAVMHPTTDLSENLQDPDGLNTNQLPAQLSSQSFLSLPEASSSDHIFTSGEQDGDKRSKRQKKREKHRQKTKSEKIERGCCTMGGATGMLVDTFQRQKQHEYERILELCHLHGVPLSKNLLQKVLLHPEDRGLNACISSLQNPSKYLMSAKDLYSKLAPNKADSAGKRFSKSKRKISFFSYQVYPPAASVSPKSERMNLSSGPADISRKADCWMTYEEYRSLTRHLDSRFEKSWKPSEEDPYWPSYVFDKVRLYLERPRTQVRSENSVFDIVHNRTIH